MKHIALIVTALTLAASALADDGKPPSTGLSIFANAGAFWADKNAAEFYSGRDDNPNTINRILHSNTYGTQIWDHLVSQGLISPSAIGGYQQLQVIEYPPQMSYRLSYQIGLGIRYDYPSGFGWLLRFDLAKLTAQGGFNLSTANGADILGSDQYITCGIFGQEDRFNIDLALTKTVALTGALDLELDLGASMLNTKVKDNVIEIAGSQWSILDRTDGRIPDQDVAEYDYINQGRIGYGVFVSALLGYRVSGIGAFKLGYTCYQARIAFQDRKLWGWHHMLGIRIEMNNFSFL